MSQPTDRELRDHQYDGITEYDNPLPAWWAMSFFACCVFAFLYWIHYESGAGPTSSQELEMTMKEIETLRASAPSAPAVSEQELMRQGDSPETLAMGLSAYQGKCAACHGDNLQGLIGPNLVDEYWIHGRGGLKEIYELVQKGVPDKGMPPWETMMKPEEISAVAAFILSKKGSQPANPKPPQGNKIE